MISITGRPQDRKSSRQGAGGFTLIEIILVMALLLIAGGLVYPTLQGFFQGRVMDSEARRLLALTRYGLSRAVSEGVPMVLWLDTREKTYGLAVAAGYVNEDPLQRRFTMDDDLTLEVSEPLLLRLGQGMGTSVSTPISRALQPVRSAEVTLSRDVATIEFLPDGYIGLNSPEYLLIKEGDATAVWLVQDTNRLNYAISTEKPQTLRR